MSHLADKMLVSFPELAGVSVFCGVLLVQRDVRLLALCSQGQTALLQLRLGVIPVLVQNELLQHTKTRTKHARDQTTSTSFTNSFQRIGNISENRLQFQTLSPTDVHAFISFLA